MDRATKEQLLLVVELLIDRANAFHEACNTKPRPNLKDAVNARWLEDEPVIFVITNAKALATAISPQCENDSIKYCLHLLRQRFLILEDLRFQTRGSKAWIFLLKLWSKDDKDGNLQALRNELSAF